jgi:hypothetical protein
MFLGLNTSNFTVTSQLFNENLHIHYWRFEVMYTFAFASGRSSSAINFQINQRPANGSCSITPLNGSTSTPFTVNCSNWFDKDGIQDYSFYGKY